MSRRLLAAGADAGRYSYQLEKLIPDLMKKADVPGVSIALIEDVRIVWVGSFGVKNVETLEPVNDRGRPEVTRVEPKQFISHRDAGAARSTLRHTPGAADKPELNSAPSLDSPHTRPK
jgi:hypothetical protein